MRKLVRIVAAGFMLASIAFAVPQPASASHDDPLGTNHPCTDEPASDPNTKLPNCHGDAYHEEMPNLAVAGFTEICGVTGVVVPGTATAGGPQHDPKTIPLFNDNPAHSHYNFLNTVIACTDTGPVPVTSDGGNDGHMINPNTIDGDGDLLEIDPVTNNAAQHPFNDHHGSVTESAWSSSDNFQEAIGMGPGARGGGPSNDCVSPMNDNKADIVAGGTPGWVKYIRVGTALYVWGCFDLSAGGAVAANPFFSAALAISVDPTVNFPLCVVSPPLPPPTPCGFIIEGVAHRSAAWAVDTGP